MSEAFAIDEGLASAYDFTLPERLIAAQPAPQRDASRLLVLDGDRIDHRFFRDLPELFHSGDVLVLNETRVIAARIAGRRAASGARIELLLLHPLQSMRYDPNATAWTALARPAKRIHAGDCIEFPGYGTAEVLGEGDEGIRELRFDINVPFEEFLNCTGRLPLPPYIHNDTDEAQTRYQTVFARIPGSVAAPTASLHFTTALIDRLVERGTIVVRIALDIGLGTFRPMKTERIEHHTMHAEHYAISQDAVDAIEKAKREGRRVIAAGTTVIRALEGNVATYGRLRAADGVTDLFVRPGFAFSVVDAAITNFHLPRSTLLVLVSAFAGRERILAAYRAAIDREYRFFSFGDAMFVTACEPR
ncbi:MAG: tRNA preQ1(34) S-adenosylmethionine ribosyltransferase-isomerase QueA [Candidatus Eremiobacteraeota bacterium]|nr:tRNA preQ1(34) S-adenosylmethionine ribosyltransferase-isomerase QueA [Candidatus Eremiobacteraeota bacterium]